jgi:hypothetical protein
MTRGPCSSVLSTVDSPTGPVGDADWSLSRRSGGGRRLPTKHGLSPICTHGHMITRGNAGRILGPASNQTGHCLAPFGRSARLDASNRTHLSSSASFLHGLPAPASRPRRAGPAHERDSCPQVVARERSQLHNSPPVVSIMDQHWRTQWTVIYSIVDIWSRRSTRSARIRAAWAVSRRTRGGWTVVRILWTMGHPAGPMGGVRRLDV